MYIKSVIIDGFKSYAQRTEIHGFDPMFNAITGLNGSGKSNILDSICFLLGISNLSQVRATNLQELVYKSGQAGVTKATVSITFDNSNKDQSPLGYENYEEITVTRQVVIGGRNKYLINGSNAQNTRVQDLFRSVQLNINNPHFLIMQGRITKVLNMKPPEILSMIEEAVGTRLYESKKETAQKTIEKKDAKLKEIDTILHEEITPTLTRLKEERSSYLEYQQVIRELEHLNKLYIAYQFFKTEETHKKSAEDLVAIQETIKKLQDRMTEIEKTVSDLDEVIEELKKKRDQESGDVMVQLENHLKEKQKEDAKAQSNIDHKREALKGENKKRKQITKNRDDDHSTLTSKQAELGRLTAAVESLQQQSQADQEALTAAQEHFHAVSAGLSSNADGEDASLQDQLMAAKKDISNAETETKQAQMRLKHNQQEVKKKQAELKKTEQGYKKDQDANDAVRKNVKKIQDEMQKLGYEDGREEALMAQKRTLSEEVHHLRERVDGMTARFPQLQFDYKDPEKNFDRSKVHGLVCKLIQVQEVSTATALEVTAGGKLYNVVVDTEMTGKKLLQKGELKRRYTIIPLNKISARSIDDNVVRRAQSLVGKDNVHTALSLIGYETDLEKAMQYVFGASFVCKDMNSAKRVTFDEGVMKKSVTLEGDSFDPAGTLTGGARAQTSSILLKLNDLKQATDSLNMKQQALDRVSQELNALKRTADRFRQLKQQHDLKQHEIELLDERLKQSSHHQQLEEITALTTSIADQEEILSRAKETQEKAHSRVKELEDKIKNAKAIREKELKAAETGVQKAKKTSAESNKKYKEKQQEVESLKLEAVDLEKDMKNYEEQLTAVDEAVKMYEEQLTALQEAASNTKVSINKEVKMYEEQLTALQEAASNTKALVKEAQTELNKQKDLLKACNQEMNLRISEQRTLQKEANSAKLTIQEQEHKATKLSKDARDAARQVEALLDKYEWIRDERQFFGKTNSTYDFAANNPAEAGRRIQKLTETKDKLSKNVNMRAMNMLGKAEEQYAELMKKKRIVTDDKEKIANVIAELDEKKNEALKKAHQQVNKDFGSIFSTLLPGTQARLVPVEGTSILDGLEVKVAFGDVWKDSLTELSGGQRSLVALSLILSLLLFKPAPLYILDEVDAALDLSHTQNIGQMLKSHFKASQFIVVSLKDGMFNNANVLFKTKFVDGVSTVTRYVQSQSSRTASTSSVSGTANKNKKTKRARIDENSALL